MGTCSKLTVFEPESSGVRNNLAATTSACPLHILKQIFWLILYCHVFQGTYEGYVLSS